MKAAIYARVSYWIRWLWWFTDTPRRITFGFGPEASRNWHIAMDRWELKEPKR